MQPLRSVGHGFQDGQARKIVGDSAALRHVLHQVEIVAPTDATTLLLGETGTGKELVARAIHEASGRSHRPFIKVNCAAIPSGLLESELFGHERGAFTGAIAQRIGRFELADGGTLFLDEVGEIPRELQPKLLRVLQEHAFERLGATWTIKVDVRLIAATNRDLSGMVEAGDFRDDLYYRLNVIQILVPALRERPEEIPLLARYFVERYAKLFQREGISLPPETLERLTQYRYPGNVRELENIIKRMIVLGDSQLAQSPWPGERGNGKSEAPPSPPRMRISLKDISRKAAMAAERQAILDALEQTRWNRIRAAKMLGISYRALLYKIKDAALVQDGRSSNPV